MKKSILFLFLMLNAIYLSATIRTVSNSPSTTIAQFSTIQAAINASNSGDTIYVHGSPISYSGFTITNKQLIIIGPGWNPDKNMSFPAIVTTTSTITGSLCNSSQIHGMVLTSIDINSNKPDGLRFIRNKITGTINVSQNSTTYNDYIFEGNVFQGGGVTANAGSIYLNFVFQNNYFYSTNFFNNQELRGFANSLNTVLIDHNLWFREGSGTNICFNNCQFLNITNNIFVGRDAASSNSNSIFNNNITFNAGNNSPWLSNGNLDAGGNNSNQDPQMVDQASVNAGTNNPLLDFSIPTGPANDAGSDGKDMGLLYDTTGSLNWNNSRNSRLPRMFIMNISNPTITSGGTLQVNIEARKSN